ncbi:MAG: alpha/beta hydrolase [Actinobacteria bacterium]|nr:alpha/beta hydrolase [Actinomycetota bacterium]
MTPLAVRRFGRAEGRRLTCVHGVTAFGGHFAGLAERLGPGFEVVAPDLLGHGDSLRDPPWSIEAHVDALVRAAGDRPGTWVGHSFGGRLALEVAARRPDLVERLVLLDPAVWLPPHVARFVAENSLGARSYASLDEAVERRFEESRLERADGALVAAELAQHLEERGDRLRYRYEQAAVVTAYSELAVRHPAFERARVETLVVLGEDSYLTYEHLEEEHREALGDLLEIATVPGGHTVLWDAPAETAAVVAAFLTR